MEYHHHVRSEQGHQVLLHVRQVCANLPEVEETVDGFGYTTYSIGSKSFIKIGETAEGVGIAFKSDHENQDVLIQTGRYVKTPYIGHHGWVSVRPDLDPEWNELSELLVEAYLRTAPKRLVRQFVK